MSLFERLGREVEKVKQGVIAARSEDATHRCRDCETTFDAEPEACPECGSDDIVAIE